MSRALAGRCCGTLGSCEWTLFKLCLSLSSSQPADHIVDIGSDDVERRVGRLNTVIWYTVPEKSLLSDMARLFVTFYADKMPYDV